MLLAWTLIAYHTTPPGTIVYQQTPHCATVVPTNHITSGLYTTIYSVITPGGIFTCSEGTPKTRGPLNWLIPP